MGKRLKNINNYRISRREHNAYLNEYYIEYNPFGNFWYRINTSFLKYGTPLTIVVVNIATIAIILLLYNICLSIPIAVILVMYNIVVLFSPKISNSCMEEIIKERNRIVKHFGGGIFEENNEKFTIIDEIEE